MEARWPTPTFFRTDDVEPSVGLRVGHGRRPRGPLQLRLPPGLKRLSSASAIALLLDCVSLRDRGEISRSVSGGVG